MSNAPNQAQPVESVVSLSRQLKSQSLRNCTLHSLVRFDLAFKAVADGAKIDLSTWSTNMKNVCEVTKL